MQTNNNSLANSMWKQLHTYTHNSMKKNYSNVHLNTSITMLDVDVLEAKETEILVIIKESINDILAVNGYHIIL